jgi:hypothetical protein
MRKQNKSGASRRAPAVAEKSLQNRGQQIAVDDVIARYPGEWILMQVTAYENGWPSRGRLLARADTYDEVSRARTDLLPQVNWEDGPLYVFDAYPPIRTGEELRQSLEDLQQSLEDLTDEDYDAFFRSRW